MFHRRYTMRLLGAALLLGAMPATGQEAQGGRIAASSAGTAGQRQTRGEGVAGNVPASRVNSRISNRVQSRIRNRIDRTYSPRANAASPFEVAADQARAAGRPARR